MSGASGSDKAAERSTAGTQQGIGQQFLGLATNQLEQSQQNQQPAIDYYQNIIKNANSGNYGGLITAAGPQIAQISQQGAASKENIYNNTPAGAGRDVALAQNKMGQAGAVSSTLNQVYSGAFTNLAGLGQAQANTGLQEAGASLRGLEGSANTTNTVMNADAQGKASSLGFLGQLASAGGQVGAAFA